MNDQGWHEYVLKQAYSVLRDPARRARYDAARENRGRILAAAHELFVSKGYGSTTIAEDAFHLVVGHD